VLVARFSAITDALGRPIDPEIFETVVALNALDIPTVMLCGGHIDDGRGLLLPWVDIEPSDPYVTKLKEDEQRLIEDAKAMHEMITRLCNERADSTHINAARRQANEIVEKLHAVQRGLRVLQAEPRKKVEKREDGIEQILFIGWIGMLIVTFFATAIIFCKPARKDTGERDVVIG
jgi:hypothetical protein